jgi:hypothetical protein
MGPQISVKHVGTPQRQETDDRLQHDGYSRKASRQGKVNMATDQALAMPTNKHVVACNNQRSSMLSTSSELQGAAGPKTVQEAA